PGEPVKLEKVQKDLEQSFRAEQARQHEKLTETISREVGEEAKVLRKALTEELAEKFATVRKAGGEATEASGAAVELRLADLETHLTRMEQRTVHVEQASSDRSETQNEIEVAQKRLSQEFEEKIRKIGSSNDVASAAMAAETDRRFTDLAGELDDLKALRPSTDKGESARSLVEVAEKRILSELESKTAAARRAGEEAASTLDAAVTRRLSELTDRLAEATDQAASDEKHIAADEVVAIGDRLVEIEKRLGNTEVSMDENVHSPENLTALEERLNKSFQAKLAETEKIARRAISEDAKSVETISALSAQLRKINYRVTGAEGRVSSMGRTSADNSRLRDEMTAFEERSGQQIQAHIENSEGLAEMVADLTAKVAKFNDRLVGVDTRAAALEHKAQNTMKDIPSFVSRLVESEMTEAANEANATVSANDNRILGLPMGLPLGLPLRLPLRLAAVAALILVGLPAAYLGARALLSDDDADLAVASAGTWGTFAALIEPVDAESRAYIAPAEANIRSGPSTAEPVVERLLGGTEVVVLQEEGAWVRVSPATDRTSDGWVHRSQLVGDSLSEAP
ncbi:MAG: SH3 domain-containing protein, partial [Alphaproteobacteria bacterium]|nr:SH3 domain-containing protein [Alphaproteobacteria bacterium]